MPFKSYPNPFSGARNRSKKFNFLPKSFKITYPLRKSLVLPRDYWRAFVGKPGSPCSVARSPAILYCEETPCTPRSPGVSPGVPWGPLGSIPWDPLGFPGIPWDPLGSPKILVKILGPQGSGVPFLNGLIGLSNIGVRSDLF